MYTIKQASIRSGVGIPLLRAWERRYGVVQPVRTPAGYRVYDDEAIERLRAMRRLVDAGWSPRDAAPRVMSSDAESLRRLSGDAPTGRRGSAASAELVSRIVDAAVRMDQPALESALDDTFSTSRFESATQAVLLPALREIGAAWERGELDVAAEHATSAAVLRRFGSAFQAAATGDSEPVVLVGLPAGSQHELAALAFATTARRSGLDVLYLGPDVPNQSWLTAIRETSAAAVVTGAVMERDAAVVGGLFAELAVAAPGTVRAVGGQHAAAVPGVGHLVLPAELGNAVELLRQALPHNPRPRGRAA
jgi:MerR family transcriptional regulator, light-induced transcriptional regulator